MDLAREMLRVELERRFQDTYCRHLSPERRKRRLEAREQYMREPRSIREIMRWEIEQDIDIEERIQRRRDPRDELEWRTWASQPPIKITSKRSRRRTSKPGRQAWRNLRYRALKMYGAVCQCCGQRATEQNPIHVDHIKPRSRFPELALSLSNLQILCRDCNFGKRDTDTIDWRPTTMKETT
jgi:5-methylcytosine-specific restriction endonuclease McrA